MADVKETQSDDGLPESLIHQIGEYAIGGFAVFYFNKETGEPEHIMLFDDPAHTMAMEKYIADWSEALHQIQIDDHQSNIMSTLCPMPIDEDEDE